MHKRLLSLFSIVLLGVTTLNFAVVTTPAAAYTVCPAAQFVADVTIPDGTYINPGANFTKTWRLKNVGTCAWSTSYALVFVSGERMGGLSPIYLTRWVSPGQNVDISVDLTAPTSGGTYRGYWMLQNANGTKFGIGSGFRNPFWVEIRVLGPTQTVVAYDFVQNMCSALWVYNGGPISCPVNNNKKDLGYVLKLDNPTLENGQAANSPGLLTVPQNKYNGMIQGIFPIDDVFRGDHFQAIIGCQYGAVNCAVTYQLEYRQGDTNVTLWKFREQYDGLFYQVDLDLSSIANKKDAKLVLSVYAAGPASGDMAMWVAPRIVRNVEAPSPTLTPATPTAIVPTFTPTPPVVVITSTPFGGCTDRAQFVTDVTVPDGTTFTPYSAFVKTWRLKNVGTCTWTTSYKLAFVSGNAMNGVDTALPQSVLPGQTVDASVNLSAPATAGSYRGYWELKNASGTLFGIGSTYNQSFWVDILVSGTAVVTPTATSQTVTPTAPSPTPTLVPTSTPFVGWNWYENTKYAFAFQIPPGSVINSQTDNSATIHFPITPGTNLGEKYLMLAVAENATSCKGIYSNSMVTSSNVTINGISFLKESFVEPALGNIYDWTAYSTMKGTTCISLTFVLHSTNPDTSTPPLPVYDRAAESAVFNQIMATYTNR